MTGYFRLKRGIFEHTIFQTNEKFTRREAWIWLIEQANYSDSKFRHKSEIHTIPRGSLASSYRAIAKVWQWSTDRVIRELNLWENEGMVVRETRHGYLQITLCKYGFYQASPNTDATPTRQQHDTDATATSTNQIKAIKEKKERNKSPPVYSPEFEEFWTTYPKNNDDKKPAFETYLKTRKDTDHGRIIEGARAYERLVTSEGRERKHIKHASTWLNARGWETEREDVQPLPVNRSGGSAGGTSQPKRSQWEIAGANVLEKIRRGEL